MDELRREIQKGIDSGDPAPLDMDVIKARGHQRLADRKQ
jgi:antitoxin ParD1/3/4